MGSREVFGMAGKTQGQVVAAAIGATDSQGDQEMRGRQAKWFKGHSRSFCSLFLGLNPPPQLAARLCDNGLVLQLPLTVAEHQVLSPAGRAYT